jgi:hypothetical protein
MDKDVAAVLNKAPLAEGTWLLWEKIFPDESVNELYDLHRGPCYKKKISFADIVYLTNDCLFQHGGRARQTLDRHTATERCPVSDQAFYGKLRRMPIALSETFLADGSNRLRPWLPKLPHVKLPQSLNEFRVMVLDGKTFKHAAKRLKPVRGKPGKGLGGKALVALELSTGLIVNMTAVPDGHTNEAKLVPKLLPKIRAQLPGTNLSCAVADVDNSISRGPLRGGGRVSTTKCDRGSSVRAFPRPGPPRCVAARRLVERHGGIADAGHPRSTIRCRRFGFGSAPAR